MVEDKDGIDPEAVRKVLSSRWTPEQCRSASSGVPKVMYLVPNSSNPSGATISLERRKELYKIAREYDLLIMEDDPYYFIQFTGEYLPTFLSMDVDGRVVRFDSFSKYVAAGLSVGYVTGPKPILDKMDLVRQSSVQASSLSQVIINELLKSWGYDGLQKHVKSVQQIYKEQSQELTRCAEKWLTGLAEWTEPTGGMYLWIKVRGLNDTLHLITLRANKKGVTAIPGAGFFFSTNQSPHIRLSFSNIAIENIDRAIQLLAESIREELERAPTSK
jgi:kynurenine/2-aminoadipate aminotransferase